MSSGKKRTLLAIFAGLGLLIYAVSITGVYQYDDAHAVDGNPYVHDIRNFFPDYFTDGRTSSVLPENSGYRPVSTLIFGVCWAIGNGKTWVFHLYKILAHVLVSWLIFLIGAQVLRNSWQPQRLELALPGRGSRLREVSPELIAAIAALFFLVHPGNSETVNYISAATTSQNTLAALFSFWIFLRVLDQPVFSRGYWLRLVAMNLVFFFSLFMKEESATLPGAVALYLLVFRDTTVPFRDWVKRAWPPFASLTATLLIALWIYWTMKPASGALSTLGASRYQYFITEMWVWFYYLAWIFRPWGYALEHTGIGFRTHLYEWQVVLGFFLNAGIIALGLRWAFFRKGLAALGFGLGWYYIMILPNSSIYPLTEPINEHRYYLAYSLLFPGLAYGIFHVFSRLDFLAVEWNFSGIQKTGVLVSRTLRPYLMSGLLAGSILALSGLTLARSMAWRTAEGLWADTVEKDPLNGRAYNNLGIIYLTRGENEKALKLFQRCAEVWDNYKYCYLNMHVAYLGLGKITEARAAIDKMYSLDHDFVTGLWYLAHFQLTQDKAPDRALANLEHCEKVAEGHHVPCLELMLKVVNEMGDKEKAVEVAKRLADLEPEKRDRVFAVGMAQINAKQWSQAALTFVKLVARDAHDPQALYNLAWVEMQAGELASSKEHWRAAVADSPDAEGAWLNLRTVAEKTGDRVLVEKCNQELQRIDPNRFPATTGGEK